MKITYKKNDKVIAKNKDVDEEYILNIINEVKNHDKYGLELTKDKLDVKAFITAYYVNSKDTYDFTIETNDNKEAEKLYEFIRKHLFTNTRKRSRQEVGIL
jgi:hypothetical protein